MCFPCLRNWRKFLALLVLATITPAVLSACTKADSASTEPPAVWRVTLDPAKLPAKFAAEVSERIYVPLYSHIYHEDIDRSTLLAGTLSIRNTDTKSPLYLKSVAYYDTKGKLLVELCKEPLVLAPMATAEIVVPKTNTVGGSGANFVVEWMAESDISEPIAEAVMISLGSAQDVSFVSRGQVISRRAALLPMKNGGRRNARPGVN